MFIYSYNNLFFKFFYEISRWILLSGYFGGKIICVIYYGDFLIMTISYLINGIENILDFKKILGH